MQKSTDVLLRNIPGYRVDEPYECVDSVLTLYKAKVWRVLVGNIAEAIFAVIVSGTRVVLVNETGHCSLVYFDLNKCTIT